MEEVARSGISDLNVVEDFRSVAVGGFHSVAPSTKIVFCCRTEFIFSQIFRVPVSPIALVAGAVEPQRSAWIAIVLSTVNRSSNQL